MSPQINSTLPDSLGHLRRILDSVIKVWPQHEAFIVRHVATCSPNQLFFLDTLSGRLLALVGEELQRYAEDYRWLCNFFLKYEMQYRRSKAIEHTDFDSIRKAFYENDEQMGRYMRGLMMSQVLWRQHAGAAEFFVRSFLPSLKDGYDYLEIGPGHGLWLSFAASDTRCGTLTGWDVAAASLGLSQQGLRKMGIDKQVSLQLQDVCAASIEHNRFDAIVISQVLELVSSPQIAVGNLAKALRPGGFLFVNCPTKMLAPDHIRVWSGFDEVDDLLTQAGLVKRDSARVTPNAGDAPDRHGYSYVAYAQKP